MDEIGLGPTQFVLPLLPSSEGMSKIGLEFEDAAAIADVSDQNTRLIRPSTSGGEVDFETCGSRKESRVRVSRKKSTVSAAAIGRAVSAVIKAGLPVSFVELQPDGTVRLIAGQPPQTVSSTPSDIFSEWEAQL